MEENIFFSRKHFCSILFSIFSSIRFFLLLFFRQKYSKLGWASCFWELIPYQTKSTMILPPLAILKRIMFLFQKNYLFFRKKKQILNILRSTIFSVTAMLAILVASTFPPIWAIPAIFAFFALFAFFAFFPLLHFLHSLHSWHSSHLLRSLHFCIVGISCKPGNLGKNFSLETTPFLGELNWQTSGTKRTFLRERFSSPYSEEYATN